MDKPLANGEFMRLTDDLVVELELHASAYVDEHWAHLSNGDRETMLDRVWGAILMRSAARVLDAHRRPVNKMSMTVAVHATVRPLLGEAGKVLHDRGVLW